MDNNSDGEKKAKKEQKKAKREQAAFKPAPAPVAPTEDLICMNPSVVEKDEFTDFVASAPA